MTLYVESEEKSPDSGHREFFGDAPLCDGLHRPKHNIISHITETHMLKPFDKKGVRHI